MSAYWLTFKPWSKASPRGWPLEDLLNLIRRFEADSEGTCEWWRIASHKTARVGDRVYIFKQGANPRGIFGTGTIVAKPQLTGNAHDGLRYRALIRLDRLVDPEKAMLLPLGSIADIVPAHLINTQASGVSVEPAIVPEIERRLDARSGSSFGNRRLLMV